MKTLNTNELLEVVEKTVDKRGVSKYKIRHSNSRGFWDYNVVTDINDYIVCNNGRLKDDEEIIDKHKEEIYEEMKDYNGKVKKVDRIDLYELS